MPEPVNVPKVDDPLAALRSSVERHAAATQASIDAGRELQQPQPPPTTTREAAA